MKLKYKAYNNISIVPVICGSDQGTAFFVSEKLLLTARHILTDAEDNGDEVLITVGVSSYVCSIVWEGDNTNFIDLAILKCDGYECPTPLKLLKLPTDRRDVDLTVCGYPFENGGGRNQFEIPVSPTACINGREYDVIVAPMNLLSFVSYKGLSGSPVLNESGSVVGVITDQMNTVLGYRSVATVADVLVEYGLECSNNWEMEDHSPYGLGHARALLEKQVKLAGDRFNEEVHVDNISLIQKLERFTDKKHFSKVVSRLKEIEKVYFGYANTLPKEKQILDWDYEPYGEGTFLRLSYFLQKALKIAEEDPRQENIKFVRGLRNAFDKVDDYLNLYYESEGGVYVIDGEAGSGKTHMVCWFAKHHQSPCYVYLIHGMQLIASQDIEPQICHLCEFPDTSLASLNHKMNTVDKYGIVIIDAINECSSGSFWEKRLDAFRQTFDKYKNLKLIITLRTRSVNISSWEKRQTVPGFENVQEAVGRYFNAFGVPDDFQWKKFNSDFRNPLFLRIFCESFRYLNQPWHEDFKQIDVYLAYIKKRNEKISELVDEDIFRNVSEKYLLKIAAYSLYYKNCQDIDREKARRIGDRICPGRRWTQSLLKNALDENLLISMPDYNYIEDEVVGFHFEKLGDFLRAYVLLTSKTDYAKKVAQLVEWQKKTKKFEEYEGKFRGLIGAFIDTCDNDNILDYKAFSEGPLREYLVEALPYNTKYNKEIIVLLLKNVNPALIHALVLYFNDYGIEEILSLHRTLRDMTLSERDATWSESINEFCDTYGYDFEKWTYDLTDENDCSRALVLLSWLLCTSYPEARARLIRKLYTILRERPEKCIFILKAMSGCDDPYVIEGVLCAVYGVVMTTRNATTVSKVADLVRNIFFDVPSRGPMDIQVRKWTLKILERDHCLTPTSKHFEDCAPPYNTPSPFVYLHAQIKASKNKDFFGTTRGSEILYHSLLGFEDFARYIIGTNNSVTNRSFLYEDRNEEVLLADIQEMVAQRIIEMGWNDVLGAYDNHHRYSSNRYDNKKERLGKKYQWLAYYNILGRLTDHCLVKDPWSTPYKKLKNCYPWYILDFNYFDPTLESTVKSVGKLSYESPFGIKNGCEWVRDDDKVPEIRFEFSDKEGNQWVRLYGYESETVKQDNLDIEGFLFFNSHFVKADDTEKVTNWAREKNFYGRSIREAPTIYEFLWNEYPWSDSYKCKFEDGEWEDFEGHVKTMVSAILQLQENKMGLDTEDYLSNAYLPCADMMDVLGLYTAERGIIRKIADDDIVAASLNQLGLKNGGIAIKKQYLNQYLEKTTYKLFYFIMGEKLAKTSMDITSDGIKELSACWYLDVKGWHEVQKISVRKDRQGRDLKEDEEDYSWLDEFYKNNPSMNKADNFYSGDDGENADDEAADDAS